MQVYRANQCTFVIVKNAQVVATGRREGIGELLAVVTRHGELLRGASLADKIVGKAVAMLAVYAGTANVYTPLGSQPAEDVLSAHNVVFRADRIVPLIRNKQNNGPCPMEQLMQSVLDPVEAVAALSAFVARQRAVLRTN